MLTKGFYGIKGLQYQDPTSITLVHTTNSKLTPTRNPSFLPRVQTFMMNLHGLCWTMVRTAYPEVDTCENLPWWKIVSQKRNSLLYKVNATKPCSDLLKQKTWPQIHQFASLQVNSLYVLFCTTPRLKIITDSTILNMIIHINSSGFWTLALACQLRLPWTWKLFCGAVFQMFRTREFELQLVHAVTRNWSWWFVVCIGEYFNTTEFNTDNLMIVLMGFAKPAMLPGTRP